MRKLTTVEFDALPLRGRGKASPFWIEIFKLMPGEGLLIERQEWKRKYIPTIIARNIEKKYNRVYQTGSLADQSGWAVKRIK